MWFILREIMNKTVDKEIYLLKGTCIPVTGYNRGIIYNLVDKTYHCIPEKYSLKLEKSRIVNKKLFSEEAISFFIDKNLIIRIKKSQIRQFPQVKPEYIPKKNIEHIIVEADSTKLDLLRKIIIKLKEFKIRSFEFVLIKNLSLENNINVLNFLKNETVKPKAVNIDYDTYLKLKGSFDFSSFDYIKYYSYSGSETLVTGSNEYHYTDIDYWKMTHKKLFFNLDFFAESLSKHSVFNKMLFIDADGNVKQMPLGDTICNYSELNKNTLNKLNTSLLWNITKDRCDVCRDCEYRYMCIDARLPIREEEAIWYFDSECNYNPYTCEWKGSENWISIEQWRKENQNH